MQRAVASVVSFVVLLAGAIPAMSCPVNVARGPGLLRLAASDAAVPVAQETLRLYFAGHATFQIERPGGAVIVLDYNGVNRPTRLPDLITMNNAHITHYTNHVPPEIKTVLRGWNTGSGIPRHDAMLKDARVRSIPTNFTEMGGGTNGNSVWVVEAAGLCIAHLSHLHHTVSREHVAALGPIDVLLAPIDGRVTMSHDELIDTIRQIKPTVIVPMHWLYFGAIDLFLSRMQDDYPIRRSQEPWVVLSARNLPKQPEILLLPGNAF